MSGVTEVEGDTHTDSLTHCMQHYELLCVLPGTLSEDETAPVIAQVRTAVEDGGGADLMVEPTSKSRLAYPMKHIRYGYFQLVYFQAEPGALPAIEAKLRLIDQLLRVVLHKHDPANKHKEHMVLAGISNPVAARKEAEGQQKQQEDPAMATQKVTRKEEKKEAVSNEPTETKAEKVDLKDINEKLDKLLESEITDV